jgi:hypothetical protein
MGRDDNFLLRAFENLVRRGRARGIGITLVTQRSAVLNKNVLTQVGTLIAMRTTSPQDQKAVGAWVQYHGQAREILESLASLQDGEAWVWSPDFLRQTKRVQFRLRSTFDSGATPRQLKQLKTPATLADVDVGKLTKEMAATIERAKQTDPSLLRAEIERLKREMKKAGDHTVHLLHTAKAPKEKIVRKEVRVVTDAQVKQFEAAIEKLGMVTARVGQMERELVDALKTADKPGLKIELHPPARTDQAETFRVTDSPARARGSPVPKPPAPRIQFLSHEGGLVDSQQRILDVLAWFRSVRIMDPPRQSIAVLTDQRPTSGGFGQHLADLAKGGLIEYPRSGRVAITESGLKLAATPFEIPPTDEALHDAIMRQVPKAQADILRVLIENHPNEFSRDELAEQTNQRPTSGGYGQHLADLANMGFIRYPRKGMVAADPILFLNGGGQ